MHQKRCITCCIGAELQISTRNIQLLNFYLSEHQVILTIFPTLLFDIWYIYPPTTSLAIVLGAAATKRMDT